MKNTSTRQFNATPATNNTRLLYEREAKQIMNNLVEMTSQQEFDEIMAEMLIDKYEQLTGKKAVTE